MEFDINAALLLLMMMMTITILPLVASTGLHFFSFFFFRGICWSLNLINLSRNTVQSIVHSLDLWKFMFFFLFFPFFYNEYAFIHSYIHLFIIGGVLELCSQFPSACDDGELFLGGSIVYCFNIFDIPCPTQLPSSLFTNPSKATTQRRGGHLELYL